MNSQVPHGLEAVFAPSAVAVIGASADPTKRGYQILRALRESGFAGRVYPVNPRGGSLLEIPVHASIASLPEAPDLAVICTPAATAPGVVAECGARGIRAAIILAVGFRESGEAGRALEEQVLEAARGHGVRVVGPNTSGLLNLPAGLNLIGARGVRSGSLSLLVQSGNMALALMNEVTRETREGIRICAGLGNGGDVGFGECLSYLGGADGTRAVVVHAEGIRDARSFLEVAARVAREKPVVLIKGARSAAGEAAARSHTGAVAGPYERLRAGMEQAGIVELQRTDELLHVAASLAWQPPAGPGTGVALLSDGGGQGALAVDTLSEMGVPLADLRQETRDALRALLGAAAAVSNPVDLAGAADADPLMFARALEVLAADPGVGAVLGVGLFGGYGIRFSETLAAPEAEAARRMAQIAAAAGTGLVMHTMYASSWSEPLEILARAHVPVVGSLDTAVRCAGELWRRGAFLESRRWEPEALPAVRTAPAVIRRALEAGRTTLTEPEARDVLSAMGVVFPEGRVCASEDAVAAAAAGLQGPLVLKVVSPHIPHKSDAGGVVVGVEGEEAVRESFRAIMDRAVRHLSDRGIAEEPEGVLVMPVLPPPGAEILVGACRDPDVGPVLSLGAGGVWVEVLSDVVHRVLPVHEDEIRGMLSRLRMGGVLEGGRGRAALDVEGVVRAAVAVSRCVLEMPQVAEVEVNPLFVYPGRAIPVDARVYLRATRGA